MSTMTNRFLKHTNKFIYVCDYQKMALIPTTRLQLKLQDVSFLRSTLIDHVNLMRE